MENQKHPKLVLTEDQVYLLEKRLKQLHGEAGAQCAFVSDLDGNILSRVGMTVGFDLETLSLFVGKWFHAAGEIGWYLGDRTAFDLSYHDGAWYDLYAANIGNYLFLTLIFAKTTQSSKIGMVWVLTRKAVSELLTLVESAQVVAPEEQEELPAEAGEVVEEVREVAAAAVDEPAAVEPDEFERSLWQVADESLEDAFSGLTYEQARAQGLIDTGVGEEPNGDG